MDVAVLLNFTSRVAFERTDPLMSLVAAKGPLLFYDRLSVGEFDMDEDRRIEQTLGILANLRNLLEARAISTEGIDDDRIRLIVVTDLKGGLSDEEEKESRFPVQKVRWIRELVQSVFGPNNPLLEKFEYAFVFIRKDRDREDLSGSRLDGLQLNLNSFRDALFNSLALAAPDEDWDISHAGVSSHYRDFKIKLDDLENTLAEWLQDVSLLSMFKEKLRDKLSAVRTVGAFKLFDYDKTVRDCLLETIGLRSREFGQNCVFFLVDYKGKEEDKIYLKSLIQFLATIDQEAYNANFKPQGPFAPSRLFVLQDFNVTDIDFDALHTLKSNAETCINVLRDSEWNGSEPVDDFKIYEPNAQTPGETDTHKELNAKLKATRDALIQQFHKVRRVPFFFGKHIDDWESWYFPVVEALSAIYKDEDENDRPLYDTPRRITNKEMTAKNPPEPVSFNSLKEMKRKLEKAQVPVGDVESLGAYMAGRRERMEAFASSIEKLKGEMPKLGYFTCLFWMGILSLIGFTLCFAFHFFWFDNPDPWYLIGIAAGAAGLLFILSAIIGQSCVKKRIKEVYHEIDDILNLQQTRLEEFLKNVENRAATQRKADIDRRNMDAIEEKLDLFDSHNKQVEIWKDYFMSLARTLTFVLERVRNGSTPVVRTANIANDDFPLEFFPAVPFSVRQLFSAMSVDIHTPAVTVQPVTSFVKRFRFVEVR